MTDYTADFLSFWTIFGAPKNASKADAFKAWRQKSKTRPEQSLHLAAAQAYNIWLAEQHKDGKGFPAKKHPATWLRGECWDGYLDDAKAILEAVQAVPATDALGVAMSWSGGPWERLREAANGEWEGVRQWASKATYIDSIPPEIMAPNSFVRDELERRYGKVIRKAFPQAQLTVKK